MKIAVVGAPCSGKTTLAARLYAECLERGLYKSRLVPEYAHEYVGLGNDMTNIKAQIDVSVEQTNREDVATKIGFNPIICDSPIWVGEIYIDFMMAKIGESYCPDKNKLEQVKNSYKKHHNQYDILIYVPLFSDNHIKTEYRFQNDISETLDIDSRIKAYIEDNIENSIIMECPKSLKDREFFIKYVSSLICEKVLDN